MDGSSSYDDWLGSHFRHDVIQWPGSGMQESTYVVDFSPRFSIEVVIKRPYRNRGKERK